MSEVSVLSISLLNLLSLISRPPLAREGISEEVRWFSSPITIVSIDDGVVLSTVARDEDESGGRTSRSCRYRRVVPVIARPARTQGVSVNGLCQPRLTRRWRKEREDEHDCSRVLASSPLNRFQRLDRTNSRTDWGVSMRWWHIQVESVLTEIRYGSSANQGR